MSRKYNTKHRRARSRYPDRLESRGLSKAPKLRPFDTPEARRSLRGLTHLLQRHHGADCTGC